MHILAIVKDHLCILSTYTVGFCAYCKNSSSSIVVRHCEYIFSQTWRGADVLTAPTMRPQALLQ